MADEAFALSPIAARSASPTDADYDTIREAFLETARGRWFLGEYTKRNRNADTAMVLDAVARIEQSLAASRAAPAPPSGGVDPAAIAAILDRLRQDVLAALDELTSGQSLSPARQSALIIREIAWGLRESGADVRICDLLDRQVRAIGDTCDGLARPERSEAVLQAVNAAASQIEQLLASGSPGAPPSKDASPEIIPESENLVAQVSATIEAVSFAAIEPLETLSQDTDVSGTIAPEEIKNAPQPSLGASLIAQGIVSPIASAKPDPLAPIRRMSQAEKIAFFS